MGPFFFLQPKLHFFMKTRRCLGNCWTSRDLNPSHSALKGAALTTIRPERGPHFFIRGLMK